jgi:flagellar basal-body rod protein FlgB
MATHAGQRQAIVAQNMANADTPGFKASDIEPFAQVFASGGEAGMRASRADHLNGHGSASNEWAAFQTDAETDPNGNSVSIELELLKGIEAKRQHDRALAIYKSSLNILRTSLGRA